MWGVRPIEKKIKIHLQVNLHLYFHYIFYTSELLQKINIGGVTNYDYTKIL